MPVTKANLALIDILFFDLTPRVSGKSAAVGSLEVAELYDGDLGVGVSKEVLCLIDQETHQLFAGLGQVGVGVRVRSRVSL